MEWPTAPCCCLAAATCPHLLVVGCSTLEVPCCSLPMQVAVGPGQLQRQTWADGERRWRSFHYSLPVACPPCQLGFAVGPFRMAPTSLPAAKDSGGAAGAAENGPAANGAGSSADAASQGDPQLTNFAPQQPPAELSVAAVLAAKPSIAPANGSSTATDGLARSAHFTGLVWRLFEEVLGTHCPLPALQQVCAVLCLLWCGWPPCLPVLNLLCLSR